MNAAQQQPGTTTNGAAEAPGLVSSPTQLDASGNGGTKVATQLSVYNASDSAAKVTAKLASSARLLRWTRP